MRPHRFGAREGVSSVNNIERLRSARGWSRPELGRRMGTSGQQIERLEKGLRSLKQEWIDKAAKALGVSPAQIITPMTESNQPVVPDELPTKTVDAGEVVQIQKLDISLSMGPGAHIEDYVEDELISFDLSFLRSFTRTAPHFLKVVKGIGDSMYPTLNWGDTILIDTSDPHLTKQDGIYWINIYGAAGIKRLRAISPEKIEIKSDNSDVPDQEVAAEDLRIYGRAIWAIRGL